MVRQCLVLDDDLGDLVWHAFTCPQIKGHTRPSPVIDMRFNCDESLRITTLSFAPILVEISGYRLAVYHTLTVLPAHHMILDARNINRPQCLNDFDLLIANTLGLKRVGRLHRHETQKLHEMVLHHVAQLTHAVVVSPTALDTHLFSDRDLNVVNAALVPLRVDKSICEPQY